MIPKYEDFFLIVGGTPGNYTVEAQGPGDIRVSPVPFVYQETEELRVELNRIKTGFAPSRERMQQVGEMLFKALFPYEIHSAFRSAMRGLSEGTYLRLKFIVRPAEISHLPWELTYDIGDRTFMAARSSRPIVRYVEQGTPPALLLARRPLRVLYLQANPKGTTPLDTAASEKALREALGDDGEVTSVRNATPAALRDVLREGAHHVLHYDGHGAFRGGSGYLYLHDANGRKHKLSGEMLATYLDGSSIRLVVLSACETAVDSEEKRFSGIAQQLMRTTRLPAVVAMQYEIPDTSAIAFTREFYKALVDDYPVDAAVVEGRKAILEISDGDPFAQPDWATPVLFMRVKDGEIFRQEREKDTEMSEEKRGRRRDVDTGGGAYIGGGVRIEGGDFVGRDKVVQGDVVHGDKVEGDKVKGDKISISDVSGDNVAIAAGRGAQAQVQTGLIGDELAKLFAAVYQRIGDRPEDPDVDKEELTETVQKVEKEAAKGEEASPKKVDRWLNYLGSMAPDILDVTVACLTNPVAGVATVIRKIAEKAKAEAEAA